MLPIESKADSIEGGLSLHSQHTNCKASGYAHHRQSDTTYQRPQTYQDGAHCQLLLQQSYCTVCGRAEEQVSNE